MIRFLHIFTVLHIASTLTVGAHDSLRRPPFPWKEQIAPISLGVASGILALSHIDNRITQGIPATRVTVDDYLQFAPMAAIYIADLAGAGARNSLWNQTKYLAIAQLASNIIVQTVKHSTRVHRPDSGSASSFPSGHTCCAFVGATALYHEFRDSCKPLAYGGFVVATAVGVLRVTNHRHWASDVLAGAGVGILVTNLVYYFEPLKRWQPFSKRNISAVPYYDGQTTGLNLCWTL